MARLGTQKLSTGTLGSDDKTINIPVTNLRKTTPEPNVQPGNPKVLIPETVLTQTTPELNISSIREIKVPTTELTETNRQPKITAGEVTVNVLETKLDQSTKSPEVQVGSASVSIPATDVTQTTLAVKLQPGAATVNVPATTLTVGNPSVRAFAVANIVSPTKAIITTPLKFVDMTSQTFKQGDLGDELTATLKDANGNIDLTKANRVELVIQSREGNVVLDEEVIITDVDQGKLEYQWSAGDPIETPGIYRAEFRVEDNAGDTETVPNSGYVTIEIEEELGE